jgi:hypothetical protein
MRKISPAETLELEFPNASALEHAFEEYLRTIDPLHPEHKHVRMALAMDADPRFRKYLELLANPKNTARSLASLAGRVGITMLEFNQWWMKASTQRALAIAQLRSIGIVEDMAADARSKQHACNMCLGHKWVDSQPGLEGENLPGYRMLRGFGRKPEDSWVRECPECQGSGQQVRPGDEHSREKLLQMAGLVDNKSTGLTLIQNFGGQSMASAVRRMDSVTIDVEPGPLED